MKKYVDDSSKRTVTEAVQAVASTKGNAAAYLGSRR
jgi:hypothetical protein